MDIPFVEGWNIIQILGEGTFGEYVIVQLFVNNIILFMLTN